jgi:arylsulfatase A-like enzyme
MWFNVYECIYMMVFKTAIMRHSYYLVLFFILGLTLSLAAVPSLISAAKSQFAFGQPTATDAGGKRPNILVIMGDDLGFSDLGSFGSEISTPHLDMLAKEGKILTNYHTDPVCSPARVSFLTGIDNHIGGIGTMYENIAPNQVGKPGYETYINNRVVTIAEMLRDAGYDTLMAGKWHLSGSGWEKGTTPYDRGFEDVFVLLESGAQHFNGDPYYAGGHSTFLNNGTQVPRPDNGTYSNEMYTSIMLDKIKAHQDNGNPLFMYLSFQASHSPFQAPQEFIKKYEGVYDVGYDNIREQRFEKQKELGIWPQDMKLPQRLPQSPAWDTLSGNEKTNRAKILQAHAAMIEDMDTNIGMVIQYLKDIGQYDNTLIVFTSDNGSSEPVEMKNLATAGVEEANKFYNAFNNSAANIGNADSLVNYGAWGAGASVSPLSYFKTTQGEGGVRPPFVMKLPGTSNQSQPDIVNAFVQVNDMTPTFLDYAGVQSPGSTYNGTEVHPIMGKSIKPLLEGQTAIVHAEDEPVAQEMFNNSAVWMGDWKAVRNFQPVGDGQWHLFNITSDIGENIDLANQHPEILKKLILDYDKFAKDVGVVVPSGSIEAFQTVGEKSG